MLAVELVAPVHRDRRQPPVLGDSAGLPLGVQCRQPVGRDGAREQELDRTAERPRFLHGEAEEVQGAFDVDLVSGLGNELGPSGQQRGQVKDGGNLELAHQPIEHVAIEDVADAHFDATAGQLGIERANIERQDVEGG